MDATLRLLSVLPAGTEVAIGGGGPLSPPDFEKLVRGLRAQGLVASVTVKPWRLFADNADYERQGRGPEGEFSMYLDAVTQTYALSSCSPERHQWMLWPLRYRKGMKGHWPSFFKMWPVFGLFGPLAFVAAIPL